jgi:hypothetical protein
MQECESLYQRLLREHPLYSRYKRQKTEPSIRGIVVKSETSRPSAVTVTASANKFANNKSANNKAADKTANNTAATKTATVNNEDDDDDITLQGLDDPDVPSQWKPINNNERKKQQQQQHEFLWKIGDTIELRSNVEGSIFSDFAIIVGTNDDGTYNMENILTGGWKKPVSPNKIHGTYEDMVSNSNSSDAGNGSEDSDRDESEEEEDCDDDNDSGGANQASSIEECVLI